LGNWVGVYCVEPRVLDAAIGSKSEARLTAVLAANPDLRQNQEQLPALRRLIDGNFSAGEQPDAAPFIYAFEAICRACATSKATVEIYVDEDMFPEMWNFVWYAAEAPQGLPMSEYGSPAVGYWEAESIPNAIKVFTEIDHRAVAAQNRGQSYKTEIADILGVLATARASDRGVYVFFNE
jgi:hypothetical protein